MKKVIAFLCVFMYFASPYRFHGHAMPEIIGLVAILLQLTQLRNVIFMKGYGAFMVYMLFVPPLISFVTGLPGNYMTSFIPVNLLFYSTAFCILLPNLDMELVLKYYRILVFLAVAFFFFQEFSYFTLGSRPTFYLPLEMYYEDTDMSSFSESREELNRSSSFFLEPAHFAQYILPYYCLKVCRCLRSKIVTFEFVVLSGALLLLQSGSGYMGFAAIWISILFMRGLVSYKIKIAIFSVFMCALVLVVVMFINNPIILDVLSRFDEITTLEVTSTGHQSGFLRIWRGYFIYGIMAPIYKIFGVGVGSIEYISNLVYIPGSRYEGAYMNGFQTLLISGGIIGTTLFFIFIYRICKNMSAEGVVVIICMMTMFFIENMMFTPKMLLFILIAIAVTDNSRQLFNYKINTVQR